MKDKTIVGFCGAARSGKDTAAGFLVQERKFARIAFAGALKAMVCVGFGLSLDDIEGDEKDEPLDWLGASPRRMMQTLGTEWGREYLGADVWVKVAWRRMHETPSSHIVFSDVRFANEAQAIALSGGKVIRIVRDGARKVLNHASEGGVEDKYIHSTIENNGTMAQFRAKVLEAIK